jgi:hypothetical protein
MTEFDTQVARLRLGATPKLHLLYTGGGRGLPIYILHRQELTKDSLEKGYIKPYLARWSEGCAVLDDKSYEVWLKDYKRAGSPVVTRHNKSYMQLAER